MKRRYRILLCGIFFCSASAQCLFNELMIDAEDESGGEFIEVLNTGSQPLSLNTFFLCDPRDTDAVIPFPDSILPSGAYGLILDPDYAGEYDTLIPDSTARFSIEDSRFGMYGISNSTSKTFCLLNAEGLPEDSYTTGTPHWPPEGYTVERYMPDRDIWETSRKHGGTPGTKNSASPVNHEMKITGVQAASAGTSLHVGIDIANTGLSPVNGFDYACTVTAFDSLLRDTFYYHAESTLRYADTCHFTHTFPVINKGASRIGVFLSTGEGIRDTAFRSCRVPLDTGDLLITEFVCKTGDRFGTEYVEVFSRAGLPVQLKGLLIADMTGTAEVNKHYVLEPGAYAVLAASPGFSGDFPDVKNVIFPDTWRSLNNREDAIRLQSPTGLLICGLHYDNDWSIPRDCAVLLTHTELDPRDPLNWEFSTEGSPGEKNSSERKLRHLTLLQENMLLCPADSFRLCLVNDGYFPLEEGSAFWETAHGQEEFQLPPCSPGDTLVLYPDTSGMLSPGTNICRLYASDTVMLCAEFLYYSPYTVSPLYFNEILAAPLPEQGQCEFIELACTRPPCDLKAWMLDVNGKTAALPPEHTGVYRVLAGGDAPGAVPRQKLSVMESFPALPNEGAVFRLRDPAGRVMDSCDLRGHAGWRKGVSLEKQYENMISASADVWHAGVSERGMSPGERNSITVLPGFRNHLTVDPSVFTPDKDERICFTVDAGTGLRYCELYCYNMAGEEIMSFERSLFSQPSTRIIWNGKMHNGDTPARGIYLLLAVLHTVEGQRIALRETLIIR
jgi:hypothetical protein